jgi:hypothetical protein
VARDHEPARGFPGVLLVDHAENRVVQHEIQQNHVVFLKRDFADAAAHLLDRTIRVADHRENQPALF